MNSSKTVALTLGPTLVIVILAASAYWMKTRPPDIGAPLELHAAVSQPASGAPLPAPAGGGSVALLPPIATPEAATGAAVPSPAPAIATQAPGAVAPPKFDVVRVEPTGDAVVAGHTAPDTKVAVIANGKVIAEGKSDAAGQFVLLPPALPPGEHSLALQITPPSGQAVTSDQNVAVSVPQKGKGDVMVALAEPGKATVLLADPTAKAPGLNASAPTSAPAKPQTGAATPNAAAPPADTKAAAAPAKPDVIIKTAEIVEPGGFFATGIAAPQALLRLYLNGSHLADMKAGLDGQWAVKVGKGLVPGRYAVRADQIDAKGGVVARAEVPFDYTPAAKPKEAVAQASPPAPERSPKPAINASPAEPSSIAAPAAQSSLPAKAPDRQASNDMSKQAAPIGGNPNNASAESPGRVTAFSLQSAKPDAAELNQDQTKTETASTPAPAASEPATVTVPEIQTTTVEKGNNLWRISRETLGFGKRYTEIYAANSAQIRDPKLIYPGQIFVIPSQTN